MKRIPRKTKKQCKALMALFYTRDFKRSKSGWIFVATGERIKHLRKSWTMQFTCKLYNHSKHEIKRGR